MKDGYRKGKSQDAINRPEAAAVAKTVIDCLNDPRYKGKSSESFACKAMPRHD